MLVDIDLTAPEMLMVVHRPDGSVTVSLSVEAFDRAANLRAQAPDTIVRAPHESSERTH